MAFEFDIQLVSEANLTHSFVRDIVAEIETHPASRHERGSYSIIGDPSKQDRIEMGPGGADDSIEDILTWFEERDPTKTSLTLWFEYRDEDSFSFSVEFVPINGSHRKVRFISHTDHISSNEQFMSFVELSADVFEQFPFIYGAYRNEHEESVPIECSEIADHHPKMVTLYSKRVIEIIGCDRLLQTPAHLVRELADEGVLLVVCTDPGSSCSDLDAARVHLHPDSHDLQ